MCRPSKPLRLLTFAGLAAGVLLARDGLAGDYYVAGPTGTPAGNDANPGSQMAPFKTIRKGASVAAPGDTVYLRGGTYAESVSLSTSGAAGSWITFSAFPGELPILDGGGAVGTGFSSSTAQYIRVVGIVSRNWQSSGFGNGWVNDIGMSNGNWQFVHCIADGNGINGIAFYNATGLLIDESIVAHSGNLPPSWSSGVNLFHVGGDYTTNVVRRTVSFENIDVCGGSPCANKASDGSGFILDQSSSGALFENNLGFRNGGSCIRINCPGAHIVNNTCYHDGLNANDQGPTNPGEIYFSNGPSGAVMVNNLAAASGWNNTMNAFVNGPAGSNNVAVNMNGPTPFFANPAGADFRLVAGSTTVIDNATPTNAPSTDIGFDPKCIAQAAAGAGLPSWWANAIDYAYIANVGGVAGCFHPGVRPQPQGGAPDVGAYEYGGQIADGGGGGSSGGGPGTGSSSSSGASSGAAADGSASGGSSSGASGADSGGALDAAADGAAGGPDGSSDDGASGSGPGADGPYGGSGNAIARGTGCSCRVGVAPRDMATWLFAGLGVLAVAARRMARPARG